ncbi:succinylglutamate desuccinylase/aspartoacylase domain-containing protein [Marinobacter mobilis]|uniref:Succinylglutamate desuccinylase / Aspartoacylase family protein n=1 Tax=Marinobacter mobilis TaxID=488533 RepID=A0A1H2WVG1_9GAMM|nr:succinylglutamate desuccinylase/aspartoacylase family protein [Marinobacter mobilis]SDW84537.1 Succinylglutamate desuccinylase / Aspartoacylase family protein [Marinobacter mobilis]
MPTSPFCRNWLKTITAALWLSAAGLPVAWAQQPDESDDVEDIAEDENVSDIDASEPRRDAPTLQPVAALPAATPDAAVSSADEESTAAKVAPNIDLKDVAPPPELQPEPEPPAQPQRRAPALEREQAPRQQPHPEQPSEPVTMGEEPAAAIEGNEREQAPGTVIPAAEPESEPEPVATSLTLLNSEILPGTATRLAWAPGIQMAGLSQPTPVLVVNGARPGPTLCLTGAIHGDELNGIEIVRRTVYDLDPEELAGRVIGIPIVNLPGFERASRYLPDRRDLNRHFPGNRYGSLADRIAYSLFNKVIRHCDMLVDIHTGSQRRTNLPQLRANMNNPEVAAFTRGFDRMAVVHSSGTVGMLRTAAVAAGITSVTLEAGESLRIQEHQIKAGVNSLNSLMEKQGMISRMFVWGEPEPIYYNSYWIRAEHGGILFSDVELGDRVREGDVLGFVSDPITNARHPIKALANGRIIGMAVDQVVMAGFAAYHIGAVTDVPAQEDEQVED